MDNHPIPQDVTGFQFKLIGSMTIKQFGYVGSGVILAVILYYLPLQTGFGIFLKTIFIPLFGGSGFLIAFVPIEGRPIDVMFGNFLRALVAPNQFVYHKTGRLFSFSTLPSHPAISQTIRTKTKDVDKQKQLRTLLQQTHPQKRNKLDEKEAAFLQVLAEPAAAVKIKYEEPQPILTAPEQQQDPRQKTGMPHVPDTPNVIAGIVKDPRGNVLPNILVEVKDKDGNPVRAFKTNPLGQFASATPLPPGKYTVELEDPKKQNMFSVMRLTTTNQILLPIEIVSHDAREELRKQLFN